MTSVLQESWVPDDPGLDPPEHVTIRQPKAAEWRRLLKSEPTFLSRAKKGLGWRTGVGNKGDERDCAHEEVGRKTAQERR